MITKETIYGRGYTLATDEWNNSFSRTHRLRLHRNLHYSLRNDKILNLHERNLNSCYDQHARGGDNDEYHQNQNKQSLTHSLYRGLYVSLVYAGLR